MVGYNRTVRVVTEAVGFVELCAVVMNFEAGTPRAFTLAAIVGDGTAGMEAQRSNITYLKYCICLVSGSDYVDGAEDGLSVGSSGMEHLKWWPGQL